ncbi:MAG: exonuclease SbcCD subunit D [Candidatus Brocadiales bacterium]
MKIIHIADTHLGFASFNGIYNETRKEDVKRAFSEAVGRALLFKPELFVHAGDLFDSPYPSYDIILFTIRELQRLLDAGVRVIVVSGTHDTPKRATESHVFSLLEHFFGDSPFIHFIYKDNQVIVHKSVDILCIPYSRKPFTLTEQFGIVVYHGGVEGLREYEGTERLLYDKAGNKCVLLGDYHKPLEIKKGWYYAGATERFTFNQEGTPCGFWQMHGLDKREYQVLGVRNMVSRAYDLATTRVEAILSGLNPEELKRLYLKDWSASGGHDLRPLMEMPFTQIELVGGEGNNAVSEPVTSASLLEDWENFCETSNVKEGVRKKGREYLVA